jgi:hypothetical protein
MCRILRRLDQARTRADYQPGEKSGPGKRKNNSDGNDRERRQLRKPAPLEGYGQLAHDASPPTFHVCRYGSPAGSICRL